MINEKKIHLRKIQTLLKYKYTPFEKEKNTLHVIIQFKTLHLTNDKCTPPDK